MERKNPVILFVWMYIKHFRAPVTDEAAFPVSAIKTGRSFKTLFIVLLVFGISIFGSASIFAQCPDAPTGNASQSFCSASSHTVGDLVAIGTAIQWYSVPSGGAPLAPSTVLGNGNHYYATQTVGGCESPTRLDVLVTINSTPLAPSGSPSQTFCSGTAPTINNLVVTGTAIKWYNAASGGSLLPLTTLLVSGTHYYASQTVSGCESISRLDITATVNISPSAPTGSASQIFCSGVTARVSSLTATGTSIKWYSVPSGGSALAILTLLVNGNHYYAISDSQRM